MEENFYKKQAIKRLLFSLLIVAIYLIGSSIILPNLGNKIFFKGMDSSINLSVLLGITGLSLDKISLFSLGLGPWMSTLILWRFLSLSKIFKLDVLTSSQSYRLKFLFSLFLGIIQAMGILSKLNIFHTEGEISTWILVIILLAGLSVAIWLGNINSQYGFGGSTLIIIVNILKQCLTLFSSKNNILSLNSSNLVKSSILILSITLLLFVVFRFNQGERRLPLIQVMLENKYLSKSYLPILTNPAGVMPFMYGASLLLIPQSLILLFWGKKHNYGLYTQMQLDHVLGATIFLITVVLITYCFSFVNVDHKQISENLQKSGDYFANVYPGKNTEKYLFHKIFKMATVSSIFNVLIIGTPLISSFFLKETSNLLQVLPMLIITIMLISEVYTHFDRAYNRNKYTMFMRSEI